MFCFIFDVTTKRIIFVASLLSACINDADLHDFGSLLSMFIVIPSFAED